MATELNISFPRYTIPYCLISDSRIIKFVAVIYRATESEGIEILRLDSRVTFHNAFYLKSTLYFHKCILEDPGLRNLMACPEIPRLLRISELTLTWNKKGKKLVVAGRFKKRKNRGVKKNKKEIRRMNVTSVMYGIICTPNTLTSGILFHHISHQN